MPAPNIAPVTRFVAALDAHTVAEAQKGGTYVCRGTRFQKASLVAVPT